MEIEEKVRNLKLDATDLRILQALQENAKVNLKELCADLNLSKTPVYERIRRLEGEGIIKQYVALIDNKKVGLPLVVFCNVSLNIHDADHVEHFREEIKKIDEITECYAIGGVYDFFLKVVVEDMEAYNRFVFEKLTRVPGIVKMQNSFVLNEIKHTTALKITKKE